MSSSLAKQLKTIQQKDRLVRGVLAGQVKRPSFLFDEKEAADYDDESIYVLALEGFAELCKEDYTLRSYKDSIFREGLVDTDLSLLTKKEKKEADDNVAAFLMLLGPHFEKKATHKVLEWMVRKWRVNEILVDALMISILPYNDTSAFVRMVQIVYFTNDSRWSFLFEKVKQNGQTISRRLLAQRCIVDPTILSLVIEGFTNLCAHIKKYPDYHFDNLYVSFVTFLMMEIITCTLKFDANTTIAIYQRMELLLRSKECPSAITGACMIFMLLCEKAPLSDTAMVYFLRKTIENCSESIEKFVLLTVIRTFEAGYISTIDPLLTGLIAQLFLKAPTHSLSEIKAPRFVELMLDSLGKEENSSNSTFDVLEVIKVLKTL